MVPSPSRVSLAALPGKPALSQSSVFTARREGAPRQGARGLQMQLMCCAPAGAEHRAAALARLWLHPPARSAPDTANVSPAQCFGSPFAGACELLEPGQPGDGGVRCIWVHPFSSEPCSSRTDLGNTEFLLLGRGPWLSEASWMRISEINHCRVVVASQLCSGCRCQAAPQPV